MDTAKTRIEEGRTYTNRVTGQRVTVERVFSKTATVTYWRSGAAARLRGEGIERMRGVPLDYLEVA